MDALPIELAVTLPHRGAGWWTDLYCPACGASAYGPVGATSCHRHDPPQPMLQRRQPVQPRRPPAA